MSLSRAFLSLLELEIRLLPVLMLALLLRLALRKAPAACSCLLWWGVFLRLACPFFFPAPAQPPAVPSFIAPQEPLPLLPAGGTSPAAPSPNLVIGMSEPVSRWPHLELLTFIWLAGMAGILLWNLFSYLRFRRCLTGAVRLRGNIWLGDAVPVPVVVGLLRPRIYLPSSLEGRELEYVIFHEESHIRRGDPWLKLLGWILAAVHWFDPLVWAALLIASQDMEAACDQRVLGVMGEDLRQEYSASILSLAAGRRIPVGPLAFGEGGEIKGRIRRLLEYRQPPRWARRIATAAVAGVLAFALLLPDTARAVPAGEDFTPWDSFYFALEPGEAAVYQDPLVLFETTNLHYQVTWDPTGLGIEVALETEDGSRAGQSPSRLEEGRGGSLRGTFEAVPAGEYRFIIRSSAQNGTYAATSRESLEITGAAAFGWWEGAAWTAQDPARAAYEKLLTGDLSLFDQGAVKTWALDSWLPLVLRPGEAEYAYLDLDGDGTDELLLRRVDDPAGYNGVFHYADGRLFCWQSDGSEGSCRDYPLVDGTMVRQYDQNTSSSYTLFRYQADGTEETVGQLSTQENGSFLVNGEEAEQNTFEQQLDALVTSRILGRSAWAVLGETAWASPRRTSGTITFPAYREGREDYNAAIYDIQPFQVSLALPEGWSVRVPPAEDRRTSFAFTPLWLYQGEEYAGSIGYNTFEIYPDVPEETFYRMVYNQLMLGSTLSWDNDYRVVRELEAGAVATVQIMEQREDRSTALRPGILAYDRDQLVYVAIDLENGRLSSHEVLELAASLEILPPTAER